MMISILSTVMSLHCLLRHNLLYAIDCKKKKTSRGIQMFILLRHSPAAAPRKHSRYFTLKRQWQTSRSMLKNFFDPKSFFDFVFFQYVTPFCWFIWTINNDHCVRKPCPINVFILEFFCFSCSSEIKRGEEAHSPYPLNSESGITPQCFAV